MTISSTSCVFACLRPQIASFSQLCDRLLYLMRLRVSSSSDRVILPAVRPPPLLHASSHVFVLRSRRSPSYATASSTSCVFACIRPQIASFSQLRDRLLYFMHLRVSLSSDRVILPAARMPPLLRASSRVFVLRSRHSPSSATASSTSCVFACLRPQIASFSQLRDRLLYFMHLHASSCVFVCLRPQIASFSQLRECLLYFVRLRVSSSSDRVILPALRLPPLLRASSRVFVLRSRHSPSSATASSTSCVFACLHPQIASFSQLCDRLLYFMRLHVSSPSDRVILPALRPPPLLNASSRVFVLRSRRSPSYATASSTSCVFACLRPQIASFSQLCDRLLYLMRLCVSSSSDRVILPAARMPPLLRASSRVFVLISRHSPSSVTTSSTSCVFACLHPQIASFSQLCDRLLYFVRLRVSSSSDRVILPAL